MQTEIRFCVVGSFQIIETDLLRRTITHCTDVSMPS